MNTLLLKAFLVVALSQFLIAVLVNTFAIKINNPQIFFSQRSISIIADIVTISGIIGLIIAYLGYRNKEKDKKNQEVKEKLRVINSVKHQLEVIGHWTGFENGGYHERDRADWMQKEFKIRGNPFHFIFDVQAASLNNINILPAIATLPGEVNEAIAWTNQWITSFSTLLKDIKRFAYSRDPHKNIVLHLKLNNALENNELTEEEELFAKKLVEMYTILHFQVIGDEEKRALHFWHKRLKCLLEKVEDEIKKDIDDN